MAKNESGADDKRLKLIELMAVMIGFLGIITILPNTITSQISEIFVFLFVLFILGALGTYSYILFEITDRDRYLKLFRALTSASFSGLIILLLFYPALELLFVPLVRSATVFLGGLNYLEAAGVTFLYIGGLAVLYYEITEFLWSKLR